MQVAKACRASPCFSDFRLFIVHCRSWTCAGCRGLQDVPSFSLISSFLLFIVSWTCAGCRGPHDTALSTLFWFYAIFAFAGAVQAAEGRTKEPLLIVYCFQSTIASCVAVQAAEARMKQQAVMPSGPRKLGGDLTLLKGLTPAQVYILMFVQQSRLCRHELRCMTHCTQVIMVHCKQANWLSAGLTIAWHKLCIGVTLLPSMWLDASSHAWSLQAKQ